MQRIPTKTHGVVDYATGALLLVAPGLLRLRTARSRALLRVAGTSALAYSLLTDYELGVWRRLPMKTHLALDAGSGATLIGAPWLLGAARKGTREWLVPLVIGVGEIAAAALTEPAPRGGAPGELTDAAAPSRSEPGVPAPPAPQARYPVPDLGAEGAGASPGRVQAASPVHSSPPIETPGPSVPAPAAGPMADTERRELADALGPDPDLVAERAADPDEALIQQEEAAAAAEVRMMAGPVDLDAGGDPAMEPLYQAGQGEAEGFERAEADLIENATHGEGHGDPLRDAITPEAEADRSTAVYGEPDEEDVTEVVADPDEPPDDPGRGPGLAADR